MERKSSLLLAPSHIITQQYVVLFSHDSVLPQYVTYKLSTCWMQCHGQWCRIMSVEDVVRGSGKGLLINLLTSHNMTNTKSPTATTSIARGGCGCRKEPFDKALRPHYSRTGRRQCYLDKSTLSFTTLHTLYLDFFFQYYTRKVAKKELVFFYESWNNIFFSMSPLPR